MTSKDESPLSLTLIAECSNDGLPNKTVSNVVNLTCNSPGFIQQYFKQSRLHHLSTWKADLCEFVGDIMSISSRKHRPSSPHDYPRIIMHIDMDCFFASVGTRHRPDLRDRPVAVAHSTNGLQAEFSSSEIASCNYLARAKGIKNGMFIGSAKHLAPDLIIIPYDFESYDSCSRELYRILIEQSDFVQAVSCDEAYVDLSFIIKQELQKEGVLSGGNDEIITGRLTRRIEELARLHAENIRFAIFRQTHCTASVGISHNLLLARVATTKAKPNGCYYLSQEQVVNFMRDLSLRDLPGIGWATAEKCTQLEVSTCGDIIQKLSLQAVQRELGEKTGQTVWDFAHGRDSRILENKIRQTIGAEINWGIRFTSHEQIDDFMRQFCDEVYRRAHSAGWTAKHITVTAKKKLYEGEPGKFLGCGHCQDLSRSILLAQIVPNVEILYKHASTLLKEMGLIPTDVRGIGIHLKKLTRRSIQKPGILATMFANATSSLSSAAVVHSSGSDRAISSPVKKRASLRSIWDTMPLTNSEEPTNTVFSEMINTNSDSETKIENTDFAGCINSDNNISLPNDNELITKDGLQDKSIKKEVPVEVVDLLCIGGSDDDNEQANVVAHSYSSVMTQGSVVKTSKTSSSTQKYPTIMSYFSCSSGAKCSPSSSSTSFDSAINSDRLLRHKRSVQDIDLPTDLLDQVDMEVLNSLPDYIRQEQIQALLSQERTQKRLKK